MFNLLNSNNTNYNDLNRLGSFEHRKLQYYGICKSLIVHEHR